MTGKYVLKKIAGGRFCFTLETGDGEVVLWSEPYDKRATATFGISTVQGSCVHDARYTRREAADGTFEFHLKAANHQVIGTSQRYPSAAARDAGIATVKSAGTTQIIDDAT